MLTEEQAADTYADATDGRRLLELAPEANKRRRQPFEDDEA
jgi:hypothetical protein